MRSSLVSLLALSTLSTLAACSASPDEDVSTSSAAATEAIASEADCKRMPAPSQWFPETKKCVYGPILTYWRSHGGLAFNGLPIGDRVKLVNDNNKIVQYFERERIEMWTENKVFGNGISYKPGDMTTGNLGVESLKKMGIEPSSLLLPEPPDENLVVDTITVNKTVTVKLLVGGVEGDNAACLYFATPQPHTICDHYHDDGTSSGFDEKRFLSAWLSKPFNPDENFNFAALAARAAPKSPGFLQAHLDRIEASIQAYGYPISEQMDIGLHTALHADGVIGYFPVEGACAPTHPTYDSIDEFGEPLRGQSMQKLIDDKLVPDRGDICRVLTKDSSIRPSYFPDERNTHRETAAAAKARLIPATDAIQYFERRRFELHPYADTENPRKRYLFGLLGVHVMQQP